VRVKGGEFSGVLVSLLGFFFAPDSFLADEDLATIKVLFFTYFFSSLSHHKSLCGWVHSSLVPVHFSLTQLDSEWAGLVPFVFFQGALCP